MRMRIGVRLPFATSAEIAANMTHKTKEMVPTVPEPARLWSSCGFKAEFISSANHSPTHVDENAMHAPVCRMLVDVDWLACVM